MAHNLTRTARARPSRPQLCRSASMPGGAALRTSWQYLASAAVRSADTQDTKAVEEARRPVETIRLSLFSASRYNASMKLDHAAALALVGLVNDERVA